MGNDENRNRPPNIPKFEIGKKGRIEFSAYKMNTGYLVINQDTNTRHALTDENQIERMMKEILEDLNTNLVVKLGELEQDSFIDVTIVLEAQNEEIIPEPMIQEQSSLDMGQLAAMINDLVGGYGDPARIRNLRITPSMIEHYMSSPRYVSVTKKTRLADEQSKGQSQHFNKGFHNSGKGKNQPPQNQERGKGEVDESGDPKPNEVK